MLIIIAMILVIIGSQILTGLYASINPFIEQLGNAQNYNIAYYGAVSSVERSYLTLRGHQAGFEGSGGRIGTNNVGNASDFDSDILKKEYRGRIANTAINNGMIWKINSMTDGVVPQIGRGDLDSDISSGNNFNILGFGNSLQYAFYKDDTSLDGYYRHVNDSEIKNIPINQDLKLSIRVPTKLAERYSNGVPLGSQTFLEHLNDLDRDGINDDVLVNRSLFGYTGNKQFTIFPTMDVNYPSASFAGLVNTGDSLIRESDVNEYVRNNNNVVFNTLNSLKTNPSIIRNGQPKAFNQSPIASIGTGFKNVLSSFIGTNFYSSKANGNVGKMNLKLSLINFLKYSENDLYPYLEVKLNTGTPVPGTNFDIVGRGKVGEYDVKIILNKPIFNTSAASDFTVLF